MKIKMLIDAIENNDDLILWQKIEVLKVIMGTFSAKEYETYYKYLDEAVERLL